MSRKTTPVDKGLLQQAIDFAEKDGPLANQSLVWNAAAEYYNKNAGVEPITHSVVYLRFGEFGLTCKTPKGKKGRGAMTEEQKAKMQEARQNHPRKSKAEQFKHVRGFDKNMEKLRKITPKSLTGLVNRLANGSRVAAEKLMCLQCVGFERTAVRECTGYSCPLFLFRPYQRDDVETDETDVEVTEGAE